MLEKTFSHFERQVESAERRVALLEVLHDPQRVEVVVERCAMAPHLVVKSRFSGVSEGGVSQVMGEGQGLH